MELGLVTRVFEPAGHGEPRSGARPLALLLHGRLESRHVDAHAALAADIRGEVDGKPVRVVEAKYRVAVEQLFARGERRLELRHAVLQRLGEALLFLPQDLPDLLLRRPQLGIGVSHRLVEIADEAMEERFGLAELVAVPDGAPDDPPQHIAPPLVARDHSVDNQERAGADVIGDDVERWTLEILMVRLA